MHTVGKRCRERREGGTWETEEGVEELEGDTEPPGEEGRRVDSSVRVDGYRGGGESWGSA